MGKTAYNEKLTADTEDDLGLGLTKEKSEEEKEEDDDDKPEKPEQPQPKTEPTKTAPVKTAKPSSLLQEPSDVKLTL